jgi:CheY-like chemotaxis protein
MFKLSSSLSVPNQLIMGDKFFRILKSFPNIMNKYNFINNDEFKITENIRYPIYKIKRKEKEEKNDTWLQQHNDKNTNSPHSKMMTMYKQLDNSFLEDVIENKNESKNNNKKRIEGFFFFHKNNDNEHKRRIIIVDDDEDILFTYRSFLNGFDYDITCFTDPTIVLNYIQDISSYDNLLIILDIRMKNLNGLQLHQQIRAIDPTIKIVFITALDIMDELLSIFPGISKEQIMRKSIDKKIFTNIVKQQLK